MAGKDKTLVYLLWDAMLENREKVGHCICKKVTLLSTYQQGLLADK